MDTIELLAEISVLKEQLKNSVEVVRCKDCKWWKKKSLGGSCELNIRLMSNDNWFCADGERRGT